MNNNRKPVKPQRKLDGSVVGASLKVGNPAATGMDLSIKPAALPGMFMNLSVDEIDFFDRNPRRQHDDELYQQIKESIRATGVQQPVHVTRRPGGSHYILAQGGNTRLKIVKELLQETGDARFASMPCIYIEYTSDENIHIAHLIENEQRADMVFWDKACAYADVRNMLQSKSEQPLGLRKLAEKFTELGLNIFFTKLGVFLYATDSLSSLGKFCNELSLAKAAGLRKQQNDLLTQLKDSGRDTEGFAAFWHNTLSDWHSQHIAEAELDVPALQEHLQQVFATTYNLKLSVAEPAPARAAATNPQLHSDINTAATATAKPSAATAKSAATPAPSPTLSDSVARQPVKPADEQLVRTQDKVAPAAPLQLDLADTAEMLTGKSLSREEAFSQLHDAVHELLAVVALDDLLILDEKMPYGFLLDFPDFSKPEWQDSEATFLINNRHPFASIVFTYLWVVSGSDTLFNTPQLTTVYNPFLNQSSHMLDAVYRDTTLREHVFNSGFGGLEYLEHMTMSMFNMLIEHPELYRAVSRFIVTAAAAKQAGLPDWDLYEEE